MIAGALVTMQALPPKLNPVIRPLMDAIKKEEDSAMQVYQTCIKSCLSLSVRIDPLKFTYHDRARSGRTRKTDMSCSEDHFSKLNGSLQFLSVIDRCK